MASLFKIGTASSGVNFKTLDEWFDHFEIPTDPDASHVPFSIVQRLGDGTDAGHGFAVAKWRWNVISLEHRYILRNTFCPYPNMSAENIYIQTSVSNTDSAGALIWQVFQTIMHWPPVDEDFQIDKELGLMLTFTHLVLVP